MPVPESFILSSDYATLKNDNKGTVAITVPANQSIANNSVLILQASIQIGTKGAISRSRITSSRYNITSPTPVLITNAIGTYSGHPVNYTIFAFTSRSAADIVTCYVSIAGDGFSPGSFTTANTAETFTFNVNTFIPPFN